MENVAGKNNWIWQFSGKIFVVRNDRIMVTVAFVISGLGPIETALRLFGLRYNDALAKSDT